MDPTRTFLSVNPSSSKSPLEELSSKNHGEKDMSNRKVMRLVNMDSLFLREFRPYENISQGLLKKLFAKEPDSNLNFEGLTLTTSVKWVKVGIQKYDFEKMFELP